MTLFFQLLINGLLVGTLYALISLGFVLIVKGSGVINFAQGELILLGGFLVAWLAGSVGIPIWLAIPGAAVAMAAIGAVIERVALRPLANEPLLSLVMATIAVGLIIRGAVPALFGETTRSLPRLFSEQPFDLHGILIKQVTLWSAVIAIVFMAGFGLFFKRSRIGLAMQAVSDDRVAAQALGVDIRRVNAAAWAISGAIAAFAGFVWGTLLGVDLGLIGVGVVIFPVVILGGLESILGALVAGVIVGVTENLSGGYLDPRIGGGFSQITPLLLLLAVLMIRPYGLFGRERIERV
jgi:branched-chain amino acid transport system permease protein